MIVGYQQFLITHFVFYFSLHLARIEAMRRQAAELIEKIRQKEEKRYKEVDKE